MDLEINQSSSHNLYLVKTPIQRLAIAWYLLNFVVGLYLVEAVGWSKSTLACNSQRICVILR